MLVAIRAEHAEVVEALGGDDVTKEEVLATISKVMQWSPNRLPAVAGAVVARMRRWGREDDGELERREAQFELSEIRLEALNLLANLSPDKLAGHADGIEMGLRDEMASVQKLALQLIE